MTETLKIAFKDLLATQARPNPR